MRLTFRLLLTFFSFQVLGLLAYCQQPPKKIRVEYAGFTLRDSLTGDNVTTFVRDNSQQIHVIHEGIDMFCDKAIYYQLEDFIEAFGNVRMNQGDSITMTATYSEYSGKTRLAFASGNVILTEPQSRLTTDTLWFDRIKQQAYYETNGTVVRDTSGTITSRVGRYYMQNKKYQFVDKVKLTNPDYTIDSDRLDFYTESGNAFLYGPTWIKGTNTTIYCERGFYDTKLDKGYFVKKSKINYENRIVEGDSLYFDRTKSFASATNNIIVTDTINNSVIRGQYAEVFRDKDSVFITKRALAITVQERDSLYIHSDTMMITGPPEHRITRAYYNAKIYKSDLSGKADSIHADQKSGLTQLINLERFSTGDKFSGRRLPVIWNMKNQMTGDSIHLISNVETEQMDSLKVFNNAFLISEDTLGAGYNQTKGQRLIGLFRDNKLYQVDIIKNAEVIYYVRNDEQQLVGINKLKSGNILLQISDNTVEEIRPYNRPEGKLYPESEFPENARLFRGFNWREEERPKSVEDLFSDDPPLELPTIKGLDEYVPQEEFFDEDMMERIDATEEEKETDEKKTGRNLPKEVLESKRQKDSLRQKPPLRKPQNRKPVNPKKDQRE